LPSASSFASSSAVRPPMSHSTSELC
jgi:hypothetical protein